MRILAILSPGASTVVEKPTRSTRLILVSIGSLALSLLMLGIVLVRTALRTLNISVKKLGCDLGDSDHFRQPAC